MTFQFYEGILRRSLGACTFLTTLGIFAPGCSVFSSQLPPSAPQERTAKAAAKCGNIWNPVADTMSAVAGLTWVFYANQKEEESRPKTYTLTDQGPVLKSEGQGQSFDALRIAGYGAMALFGASSLYGYFVESKCWALRREVAARTPHPTQANVPARPNPPKNVAGFTFGMTQAQAEQICIGKHQDWKIQGANALCVAAPDSAGATPLRLAFQSGLLYRIAAVHRAPPEQIAKTYDDLYAALKNLYGAPQLEPAPLSKACSAALAECIIQGERPQGPVWQWANSSVELQPALWDDHVAIEERYVFKGE